MPGVLTHFQEDALRLELPGVRGLLGSRASQLESDRMRNHPDVPASVKGPSRVQPQWPPGRIVELDLKPDHGEESYCGAGRMEGRVALVTEGDSGLGRAVAIAFAREGAHVAISYTRNRNGAEETAHWIGQAGRQAMLSEGDVADPEYRVKLLQRVRRQLRRLDVLVNNSAFEWVTELDEQTQAAELEAVFRTRNESVFFLSELAADLMEARSSIILTTAVQGEMSQAQGRAHAANGGAVGNIAASLARRFAPRGIRVSAVATGPVWTPRVLAALSTEEIRSFGASTCLGRPAQPAEVAPTYVWLASAESGPKSGEVLRVTLVE